LLVNSFLFFVPKNINTQKKLLRCSAFAIAQISAPLAFGQGAQENEDVVEPKFITMVFIDSLFFSCGRQEFHKNLPVPHSE
jgi:hypothetical protein